MPSTMMPEKAVDNAGTHAPTGVDDTAESHTGVAIPACMVQLSSISVIYITVSLLVTLSRTMLIHLPFCAAHAKIAANTIRLRMHEIMQNPPELQMCHSYMLLPVGAYQPGARSG